jgi:hypothetical protein
MKAALKHFKAKRSGICDLPSKEGFIDLYIFTTSVEGVAQLRRLDK